MMINLLKILLQASIISSIMICAIVLFRLLFSKKLHPSIISFLWVLVLVKLCIPVNLNVPFHISDILPVETSTVFEIMSTNNDSSTLLYDAQDDTLAEAENSYQEQNNANRDFTQNTLSAENDIQKELRDSTTIWNIFSLVWITGVILTFCWFTITSALFLYKVKKQAKLFVDADTLAVIKKYKKTLNINRKTQVLSYPYISFPLVFGYFKPKILLPVDFNHTYDSGKVDGVIVHELIHIKRHDMLLAFSWMVIKAVYWFNPLVWLANSLQKKDAEITCDYKTIKMIGRRKRSYYGETLILAARHGNKLFISNTALSFQSGKSNIRRRINMIMFPIKRSKSVTVISLFMTALMVVACFTTACQKTPEELIVKNKAGEEMQNAINATANPNVSQNGDNNETTILTEHITKSMTNDLGTITINFDADVSIPDVDKIPIAVVKKHSFTQEQLDSIIRVFAKGEKLHKLDTPLTKEEIDEIILKLKRQSTDMNSDMAQSPLSIDLETGEGTYIKNEAELLEYANELIAEWEQKRLTAPDTYEYIPPNMNISESENEYIEAKVDLGKTDMALLGCKKDEIGESLYFENFDACSGVHYLDLSSASLAGTKNPFGVTISYDQAKNIAFNTLLELNLNEEFVLGDSYVGKDINDRSENKEYYVLYFDRVINSFPVTHSYKGIAYNSNDDPAYIQPLQFEKLAMWIDDTGVVQFLWDSPLSITEIVNDNVAITVDAEKAAEAIGTQWFFEYADLMGGQCEEIKIDISAIKLGLYRIRYRGHPGEYILVPVWDFYGSVSAYLHQNNTFLTDKGKEMTPIVDGMYVYRMNPSYQMSIGTVNTLDGTIINRELGY